MKILVKYPTRERPHLFLKNIKEYSEKASANKADIHWLVSIDNNDQSMTDTILSQANRSIEMSRSCYDISLPDKIQIVRGNSTSKIHAVNRDIELSIVKDWDILLVVSDDMWVQADAWDDIIRNNMKKYFPDTDGALWFHDGTEQKRICTLSCIGRKYYEKLGNVYYPEYKSFFCDNEFTDVAMRDGKMVFIDTVIAKHEHPDWAGQIVNKDALYRKNDSHWEHDEKLYNLRKSQNFPR